MALGLCLGIVMAVFFFRSTSLQKQPSFAACLPYAYKHGMNLKNLPFGKETHLAKVSGVYIFWLLEVKAQLLLNHVFSSTFQELPIKP